MARGGIGGALKYVGHFAKGYLEGQEMLRKRKLEDEEREDKKRQRALEEKRMALENEKLESDKLMREKLGRIEEDLKPTQGYVVETPEGRAFYADEKSAAAHADAAGVVARPVFSVAGQTFDDKDSAQVAAEQANSPAVRMRKKADIYAAHGREDLAQAAMQNYRLTLDNNRREMQQSFLIARQTGDVKAVVDAYNRQLPNGLNAEVVKGQDGADYVQLTKGGQPVGKPQAFNWDVMERQVMATPDNMLELWRTQKDLELRGQQVQNDTRRTDATVKQTDAQIRNIDAQTADIPAQAQDRRTQAGAAATSAGAAATNARTGALQLTKPTVSAVPDAKGGLNFTTAPQTVDKSGNWTLGKPQVAPAGGGLQYPAGYVAGQRNQLPGLGGLGMPQVDPAAVEGVLQRMEEEARRRAAARGKGREVTGVVE